MKETIKDIFYSLGAELCGVAAIDRFCAGTGRLSPHRSLQRM